MEAGRTLILAVDGLEAFEATSLLHAPDTRTLTVRPGGPSESAPALASLTTGATVAHTGVATEEPFDPTAPERRSTWYSAAMRAQTLFCRVREAGGMCAALQWPATAGSGIDLCLPLVEDLRHYRNRWQMTEATSSPRMVAEHLAQRRAAGVQLSQVAPDALVAEIAEEALAAGRIDLMAVRLTGLGAARRCAGLDGPEVSRSLSDTVEAIQRIRSAFATQTDDRVVLVPGRPLVPTALLVHPNTELAAAGLLRTDGTRIAQFRALVWPDGPRGVIHVRREEPAAVREQTLAALRELGAHTRLTLREVADGVGATRETDVIGVLEGTPGTVFGLPATHRPLVDGEDPYYAGPRAVSDPSAPTVTSARGPGLPEGPVEGSWADLGVTLATAMGVQLPDATASGMRGMVQPV
ncbi:alkaline phosphatase family protein [Brachybacterium sp. UMB0905]|uniref:alkaline phosphatase family protein n=1 Tax=Brachybacterium sp. UMB0905 TaxID=2069310 RepID=UPI000C8107B2|nr:alkaline phosphatase family protein [Brachybacterium sp. UMB0905]PMC74903.1 phosphodiesterase [Brachybacterium sp. UMB0905]